MISKLREIQKQMEDRGYDGAIVIGYNDDGFGVFMTDNTDEPLAVYLLAKAQHIIVSDFAESPTLQ
jgi:hypothetical protein